MSDDNPMSDFNLAKALVKRRLYFKVQKGELTQKQADEILMKLDERR